MIDLLPRQSDAWKVMGDESPITRDWMFISPSHWTITRALCFHQQHLSFPNSSLGTSRRGSMEAFMKSKSCRFAILFSIISLVGSTIFLAGCSDFAKPAIASTPEGYLFCFWNVENFFDDQEDDRLHGPDREYDRWYANDPAALKLKLAHLSE